MRASGQMGSDPGVDEALPQGSQPGRPSFLARLWQTRAPIAFTAPAVLICLLLIILPFFTLAQLSLFEWNGFPRTPKEWVGLDNYHRALFRDPVFWQSTRNTFAYVMMVVIAWSSIALILALLLSTQPKGFAFYRAAFFIPVVLSEVAVAIAWRQILEPNIGFLNTFLESLGVVHPPIWLGNPNLALPALAVISIWQYVGYSMVIYLAGLQAISKDLTEAAKIDGATTFETVRFVTLPLLRPTIITVLLLNIIGAWKVFTVVFAVTQGGPANTTQVLTTYMYLQAYTLHNQGYASAIAMILIVIIIACIFLLQIFAANGRGRK